jgi:predicted nucleic acid-binding protein
LVNVVDSSAWLSYFAGDANAAHFAPAIEDLAKLVVPSITITEVGRRIAQQRDEPAALRYVALMMQGRVVDLDADLALAAARFGLRHRLPLADSIVYATARRFEATVWTQDADFDGLPDVRYFVKA